MKLVSKKLLSFESQDITLIDTNRDSLNYADTHLDIRVIRGDAYLHCSFKGCSGTQNRFGDWGNFQWNYEYYGLCTFKTIGAKRTIARISNTEFLENQEEVGFVKFGIDELISPALASNEIGLLLNKVPSTILSSLREVPSTMIGLSLSRTAALWENS